MSDTGGGTRGRGGVGGTSSIRGGLGGEIGHTISGRSLFCRTMVTKGSCVGASIGALSSILVISGRSSSSESESYVRLCE